MGQALGNVLPLAIAVAIFPVPIIAVVLVLASERGPTKGSAFVLAWAAGLAAVAAIVLVVAGVADASEDGEPATWVNVLLLGLGLVLLALAVKQWLSRPSDGEEAPTPGWMRTVDEFTVAKAGVAGFALSALNPKNVLLTVAAATEIAEVELPVGQEAAVLTAFVVLASLGVLTPLVLALARPGRPIAWIAGWPEKLDGASHRGDHGRPLPAHRREADCRCGFRLLRLNDPRRPTQSGARERATSGPAIPRRSGRL